MITVRKHFRVKRSGGVSTVRKHSRNVGKKDVTKFKSDYNIKTPIKVTSGDYEDKSGTSLAVTESTMYKGKPKDHKIITKDAKIKKFAEDKNTLVHHELSHVLYREKNVTKYKEFRTLMNYIKKTETYKKHSSAYGKDTEELFARAYSQSKTGDTKSNPYLFTAGELKIIKPLLDKLLKKIRYEKKRKG